MAKKVDLTRKAVETLASVYDMDTIVYYLTQYAWDQRDIAEANSAEQGYWQKVGSILQDAQGGLEDLNKIS